MISAAIRQALLQKQRMAQYASASQSKVTSVPAPTGGINTIASLDNMPPTDAVGMTNWFPDFGSVRVRSGTAQRYTGIGTGDVLTLAEYFSGTNRKLLASSQTSIYDAVNAATYQAQAAFFDGTNDYLQRGADLTNLSDGKAGTFSGWLKITGGDGTRRGIMCSTPGGTVGIRISIDASNNIRFEAANSANTKILDMKSTTAYTAGTQYIHVMASWDLAAAATNLYINNVSDKITTTATNDTIDYTKGDLFVAKDMTLFTGAMSEIWFDDSYLDLSVSGNRAKFIDANGLPVSLGTNGATPTGSQPCLYLNGTYLTFGTNAGSGGNFTVTGTLTQPSTTPSSKGSSLLSGQTSGRWQTANFMSNMLWVNGQDQPQVFGGSAFTSWTGSCSGMTPTSVIGCNVYRNRIYVWMANDSNFFYGATQTIGGTFVKFQLGDVANHGGNIVSIKTLSHDGGNGPTDYLAIFMSSGDVIVYSGDPASTFTLVGIYRIPPPMGIRSVVKFGGDILIQTNNDYVLFSQVLSGVYKNPSKISGAMQAAAQNYSANSGWQLLFWPEGSLVVGNVPVSSTKFTQHVFNVSTNAWTTYADLNARCWGMYKGSLYFGAGDGSIYQAETGYDDNGVAISADVQQAFHNAGLGGRKQVTAYRPVLTALGTLSYQSGIAYDYAVVNVGAVSSQVSTGAAWDASAWDTTPWSPETQLKQSWNGANGIGYKVSTRIKTSTMGQAVNWYRTDFTSVPAGPI